jgi:hypothetical protein
VPEADVPFIYRLTVVGIRRRIFNFDKERDFIIFSNEFTEDSDENKDNYKNV